MADASEWADAPESEDEDAPKRTRKQCGVLKDDGTYCRSFALKNFNTCLQKTKIFKYYLTILKK